MARAQAEAYRHEHQVDYGDEFSGDAVNAGQPDFNERTAVDGMAQSLEKGEIGGAEVDAASGAKMIKGEHVGDLDSRESIRALNGVGLAFQEMEEGVKGREKREGVAEKIAHNLVESQYPGLEANLEHAAGRDWASHVITMGREEGWTMARNQEDGTLMIHYKDNAEKERIEQMLAGADGEGNALYRVREMSGREARGEQWLEVKPLDEDEEREMEEIAERAEGALESLDSDRKRLVQMLLEEKERKDADPEYRGMAGAGMHEVLEQAGRHIEEHNHSGPVDRNVADYQSMMDKDEIGRYSYLRRHAEEQFAQVGGAFNEVQDQALNDLTGAIADGERRGDLRYDAAIGLNRIADESRMEMEQYKSIFVQEAMQSLRDGNEEQYRQVLRRLEQEVESQNEMFTAKLESIGYERDEDSVTGQRPGNENSEGQVAYAIWEDTMRRRAETGENDPYVDILSQQMREAEQRLRETAGTKENNG